jgi:hypothetical protein
VTSASIGRGHDRYLIKIKESGVRFTWRTKFNGICRGCQVDSMPAGKRQFDSELRSARAPIFGCDLSIMRFHDRACDRQSHPHAMRLVVMNGSVTSFHAHSKSVGLT